LLTLLQRQPVPRLLDDFSHRSVVRGDLFGGLSVGRACLRARLPADGRVVRGGGVPRGALGGGLSIGRGAPLLLELLDQFVNCGDDPLLTIERWGTDIGARESSGDYAHLAGDAYQGVLIGRRMSGTLWCGGLCVGDERIEPGGVSRLGVRGRLVWHKVDGGVGQFALLTGEPGQLRPACLPRCCIGIGRSVHLKLRGAAAHLLLRVTDATQIARCRTLGVGCLAIGAARGIVRLGTIPAGAACRFARAAA